MRYNSNYKEQTKKIGTKNMLRNQLKTKLQISDLRALETDALEAHLAEIDSFLEDTQFYGRRPRYIWNVLDNRDNIVKVLSER